MQSINVGLQRENYSHIHEGKWNGPVDRTVNQIDHVISDTVQTYLLSGVIKVLMLIRIII
jgi:hypothetical protein